MRSLVIVSLFAIVGCSAASPDLVGEDAGQGRIVPVADGGADAADAKDAKADAHVDASKQLTPTCPSVPDDESSFQHQAVKPAKAFSAACGAGDMAAYFYACLDSTATSTSCSNFQSAHSSCASCLAPTDQYASSWGPLVAASGYWFTNAVGCVELLTHQNPAPPGSCADAAFQDDACAQAACTPLCPTDTSLELDEFFQCETNATTGTCKPWDDATNVCQTDAGVYASCFVTTDFKSAFEAIAPAFCGGS